MKKCTKMQFLEEILQVLLLLLVSCLSGIFAGMGMGGGTFLIPLLSIFFSVKQILCQSTNVIVFVLLATICSVVYIKNKLIDFRSLICIAIPATAVALLSSFFAIKTSSEVLKICFAVFIILVGVFYFTKTIIQFVKEKKSAKKD